MMDLQQTADLLRKRLQLPLPGSSAHEPLRATPVGSLKPDFQHLVPPKPGSVMIFLYPEEGRIKFPLIKRADYNGTHSGQISLPGGKAEAGETAVETALRECEEEVGVPRHGVDVIGKLSNFFVIPSNFIITPVIAYCLSKPELKPDPIEVARIITCDLFDLLPEDAVKVREILAANRYTMNAPHFEIEGEIVWGATAMMLNEFRVVLKEIMGA